MPGIIYKRPKAITKEGFPGQKYHLSLSIFSYQPEKNNDPFFHLLPLLLSHLSHCTPC